MSLRTLALLPGASRFASQRYSELLTWVPELGLRLAILSKKPFACKLNRAAHEEWLASEIEERGHRLLTGVRVEAIKLARDAVELKLRSDSKAYDAAVIAEGYPPALASSLSLAPRAKPLVGVQVVARAPRLLEEALGVVYSPSLLGGFAWLVPLGEGLALSGLATKWRGAALRLLSPALKLLSTLSGSQLECASRPFGGYVLRARPTWPLHGRVAVFGDAAGMVKGLSGGGLYAVARLAKPLAAAVEAVSEGLTLGQRELKEIKRTLATLYRSCRLADALDWALPSTPPLPLSVEVKVEELEHDDHLMALLKVIASARRLHKAPRHRVNEC